VWKPREDRQPEKMILASPNRLTSRAVAAMLNHGKGQLIWNILTEG
jgi:hypothetical protein